MAPLQGTQAGLLRLLQRDEEGNVPNDPDDTPSEHGSTACSLIVLMVLGTFVIFGFIVWCYIMWLKYKTWRATTRDPWWKFLGCWWKIPAAEPAWVATQIR